MQQFITPKGLRLILLVSLLGVLAVVLSVSIPRREDDLYAQQRRNMDAATKHAPSIERLLRTDSRFAHLRFGAFTGGGGSLLVDVTGMSDGDLQDLKRIVESSKPPVQVVYMKMLPAPM